MMGVAWEMRVVKELGEGILKMIKVAVELVVVFLVSTDSDIAVEVE